MQITHPTGISLADESLAGKRKATALDSPSGADSGAADATNSEASITANDFLTLLVAEMKNQDPTANTDPNAYIDQLVQVNSLEQLIQINQDLGGGSSSASSGSGESQETSIGSRAVGAASRLATSLTHKPSTVADSSFHPAQSAMTAASSSVSSASASAAAVRARFRRS